MNTFEILNNINVNGHTEKKNGLTYLAWAWAWGELKKRFPASYYTIYENKDGWNYHTDGRTCWVKTGVTLIDSDGVMNEAIEYLPVMDFKNRSIPANAVTSFDVNKAIQRSLTKAVARHGLGLYIYAGEDLPETEAAAQMEEIRAEEPAYIPAARFQQVCRSLGIMDMTSPENIKRMGEMLTALKTKGMIANKKLDDMTEDEHRAAMTALLREYGNG